MTEVQRHQQVAHDLRKGSPISHAMLRAGYPKARANRGVASLPKGVLTELAKHAQAYRKLGREFSADDRADIVRGALMQNVLERKDKAVRSIELMGRDVAVGVFKGDSAAVSVQISLPAGMESLFPELKTSQSLERTIEEG